MRNLKIGREKILLKHARQLKHSAIFPIWFMLLAGNDESENMNGNADKLVGQVSSCDRGAAGETCGVDGEGLTTYGIVQQYSIFHALGLCLFLQVDKKKLKKKKKKREARLKRKQIKKLVSRRMISEGEGRSNKAHENVFQLQDAEDFLFTFFTSMSCHFKWYLKRGVFNQMQHSSSGCLQHYLPPLPLWQEPPDRHLHDGLHDDAWFR